MKLFHLSDLHIGKYLNGYPLKENQELILAQIVQAALVHRPDAILICGDIYDKSVPSGEAYTVFGRFLEQLSEIEPEIPVLIIAGNHDSPERLRYASSFLEKHHIYISVYPPQSRSEFLKKITFRDEYGPVHCYLLPFMKPGYVRTLFEEGDSSGYESALRSVLEREEIDYGARNVLLSHQFYMSPGQQTQTCESEQAAIIVGGLDHISAKVVEQFDYVALGHLHSAQKIGADHIRYCGSPYKYSVSEQHHNKGITAVTIKEKGSPLGVERIPLTGIQDVRKERGTLAEVISRATEKNCHDFISVTITDEAEPYNLREQLEEVYDHLLELKIDNTRTRSRMSGNGEKAVVLRPYEAFEQFYKAVCHSTMTETEAVLMEQLLEEAKEEAGI